MNLGSEKETRLIAERDLKNTLDFNSKTFVDLGYDEINRVISGEKNQFNVHQKLVNERFSK